MVEILNAARRTQMGNNVSPSGQGKGLLPALRDFFMALDEAELAAAYGEVCRAELQRGGRLPLPEKQDWEQTLFGFNRLFVGPMALLAPPYASVWLEPEPYLMGASTLETRHVYQVLGLESPLPGKLPDDHLSLELDVLAAMQAAQERADAPLLRALRRHFLESHVLRWMPRFCARILELEQTPPAVSSVASALRSWLERQQSALAVRRESLDRDLADISDILTTSETLEVRS